jgi:hypothetical protein
MNQNIKKIPFNRRGSFFCSEYAVFVVKFKLAENLFGNNKKNVAHLHRNKKIIQVRFNLLQLKKK